MDDLHKQLIMLHCAGIYITHADGQRWINEGEETGWHWSLDLKKHGILVNNKIYGGVREAIMVVDETWRKMYGKSLVEDFDSRFDDNDVHIRSSLHGRIEYLAPGEGGLE